MPLKAQIGPTLTHEIESALAAWKEILPEDRVINAAEATQKYGTCTTGLERGLLGALVPQSADQIPSIVQVAHQNKIAIYPISTGKNWGYNSALPAKNGCILIDLSELKKIIEFDPKLGTITLEPGVTQGQLSEYLDQQKAPFLVPTTGAGPACSLIGNAIERGYGITPYCDHFLGLLSLEAVLPNGQVYRSPLSKWRRDFKWGIGPYSDGIFTQGRAGIVTRATFALARRPQSIMAFMCPHVPDEKFEEVVDCIREMRQTIGANLGGINLMNARRILSMTEPPPSHGKALSPQEAQSLARARGVGDWTLTGGFYGEPQVQKAAASIAKKLLKKVGIRTFIVHRQRARQLKLLGNILQPFSATAGQWCSVRATKLNELLDILEGKPSEVALALSYWRSGTRSPGEAPHPAQDGCGLTWYSPLVPMKGDVTREYVQNVERICLEHNLDPLITLTTISDQLFDSTIPLLFDRNSEAQKNATDSAYRALFQANASIGCVPYRIPYRYLDLMKEMDPGWQKINTLIHKSLDPEQIFSPGRYEEDEDGENV